jgi:hypothetical protein
MKRLLLVLPFVLAACDSGVTTAPSESFVKAGTSMSAKGAGGSCTLADGTTATTGFDQYGYNRCAGIFNGTGTSWSIEQGLPADYLGAYAPDKLVMKWNAAWDACNALGTAEACAGAWTNNEWNGMVPGGSGAVWKYKMQWVGPCGADGTPLTDGGYCIWGVYEVLMDQGRDPSYGPGHFWFAHAKPNGYGN